MPAGNPLGYLTNPHLANWLSTSAGTPWHQNMQAQIAATPIEQLMQRPPGMPSAETLVASNFSADSPADPWGRAANTDAAALLQQIAADARWQGRVPDRRNEPRPVYPAQPQAPPVDHQANQALAVENLMRKGYFQNAEGSFQPSPSRWNQLGTTPQQAAHPRDLQMMKDSGQQLDPEMEARLMRYAQNKALLDQGLAERQERVAQRGMQAGLDRRVRMHGMTPGNQINAMGQLNDVMGGQGGPMQAGMMFGPQAFGAAMGAQGAMANAASEQQIAQAKLDEDRRQFDATMQLATDPVANLMRGIQSAADPSRYISSLPGLLRQLSSGQGGTALPELPQEANTGEVLDAMLLRGGSEVDRTSALDAYPQLDLGSLQQQYDQLERTFNPNSMFALNLQSEETQRQNYERMKLIAKLLGREEPAEPAYRSRGFWMPMFGN